MWDASAGRFAILSALTDRARDAVSRGEIGPWPLLLLLRQYRSGTRSDLADVIGDALARSLEPDGRTFVYGATAWLAVISEAADLSDDRRIPAAAADLATSLSQSWSGENEVEALAPSIDACLGAAALVDSRVVSAAVDELERLVAGAYRPGCGVARRVDRREDPRARLGDQVRTASALLTAYGRTGRIPYAMLAEELMRFALRTLRDDRPGAFVDQTGSTVVPCGLNCEAARVLIRLATLHGDTEYRDRAVLAAGADYAADVWRTLDAIGPSCEQDSDAALYGIALDEALRSEPPRRQ